MRRSLTHQIVVSIGLAAGREQPRIGQELDVCTRLNPQTTVSAMRCALHGSVEELVGTNCLAS